MRFPGTGTGPPQAERRDADHGHRTNDGARVSDVRHHPPRLRNQHRDACTARRVNTNRLDDRRGAQPGTLAVYAYNSADLYVVEVSGELNLVTRDRLAEALAEALEDGAGHVVLDLSRLETIDRAAVDTILTAHLRASDQLKQLVIVPGPSRVQRVFDLVQGPFCYAEQMRLERRDLRQ
jgi:anti-sigma B factor antagonist